MPKQPKLNPVSDDLVLSKILVIRGKKVMLDRDLAELYGVTTFRLNEQVRRNAGRFPDDFMFVLTKQEKTHLVETYEHLRPLKFSPVSPKAFTEHGAVMLASVLNSDRAIQVNIQIVRIFVRIREMLADHQELLLKMEQLERQTLQNTADIQTVYSYIKALIAPPEQSERNRIDFKRKNESD